MTKINPMKHTKTIKYTNGNSQRKKDHKDLLIGRRSARINKSITRDL